MKHTRSFWTTKLSLVSILKKNFYFFLVLFFIRSTPLFSIHDAFEYTYGKTKVAWSGFIKADTWADSRQVVSDRHGEYLLYPRKIDLDICCHDKNAHGQYSMSLIESNIGVAITAPKIGNATPQAIMHVNFWGVNEDTAYLPRLLNTYVSLDWEKDFLLLGQYEHPLAATNCGPATISYNWGAPMQAQALQPQLRYMHRTDCFNIITCLLTQVASSLSNGPDGFSSTYLRNSMIPDTVFNLEWHNDSMMVCGIFDVKRLRPRLINDFGNKVNETITSLTAAAGFHYGSDTLTINSKLFYAQNGVDQTLLSGYGIATRNNYDYRTYTNLQAVSWWLDINKPLNRWTPGIFLGCTKNIGAQQNLYLNPETNNYTIYSLDVDAEQIDYLIRVSPRVLYTVHPFQCGAELEYTQAAFGTVQRNGTVKNTDVANNIRLMLSFYYLF